MKALEGMREGKKRVLGGMREGRMKALEGMREVRKRVLGGVIENRRGGRKKALINMRELIKAMALDISRQVVMRVASQAMGEVGMVNVGLLLVKSPGKFQSACSHRF